MISLLNEGSHFRLYEKLGAHPMEGEGKKGTHDEVVYGKGWLLLKIMGAAAWG